MAFIKTEATVYQNSLLLKYPLGWILSSVAFLVTLKFSDRQEQYAVLNLAHIPVT